MRNLIPGQRLRMLEMRFGFEQASSVQLRLATSHDPLSGNGVKDNPLTPRELEVLQLMANGLTYREISKQLRVKLGTIDNYATEIRRKLGVSTRDAAVGTARERGWLPGSALPGEP